MPVVLPYFDPYQIPKSKCGWRVDLEQCQYCIRQDPPVEWTSGTLFPIIASDRSVCVGYEPKAEMWVGPQPPASKFFKRVCRDFKKSFEKGRLSVVWERSMCLGKSS